MKGCVLNEKNGHRISTEKSMTPHTIKQKKLSRHRSLLNPYIAQSIIIQQL